MKKMSLAKLSRTVVSRRKALHMNQAALAEQTGINRSVLSRLEAGDYVPSIPQLETLGAALSFEPTDMFETERGETAQPPGRGWRWQAPAMWACRWRCYWPSSTM